MGMTPRQPQAGRVDWEYAVASILVIVVAAFLLNFVGQEVRFCRRVLTGLANGNPSVRQAIDWERLQAIGIDVGAAYAQLPSDKERREYQDAFIRSFAEGFRQQGGSVKVFTHWRVEGDGTVAADYPAKNRNLLFQLSGGWRKQVVGIQWQ